MTEVRFTFCVTSAYFQHGTDYVVVGLQNYALSMSTASDDDIIEHINWQIEHEMLHKVLLEQVSVYACKMLDSEKFKLYIRMNPEGFKEAQKINSKLGWFVREDDF